MKTASHLRRDVGDCLVLKDISISKHGQSILGPLSASLPRGELIVVAGPNGAGKSTLLRCLAGLEDDMGGSIACGTLAWSSLAMQARAQHMAWVPSLSSTPFDFDVASVVMMGRFPQHHGRPGLLDTDRVRAALADVGLTRLSTRSLRTLSSGEMQRCLIARALASDASVLLLDEPCANLDMAAALSVLAVLKNRADQGQLVILTLHDISLAARFADYGLLLRGGSLMAAGPAVFTAENLQQVFQLQAERAVAASGAQTWILNRADIET